MSCADRVALTPLSPVHLSVRADGAGGWAIGWTRRSRNGWRWFNGNDAPLAEETERYALRLLDGATVVRSVETGDPGWTYTAAMIAGDGTAGRTLEIEVRQRGTYALGRPGRAVLAL